MAVMRCYVLSNYNVEHLEQSRFLDATLHLPKKFGTTQKERSIIWQRLKGQLENQVDVKKEDQIIYVIHSLNQETNDFSGLEATISRYLCFSIGNGKKDTLRRIFIKAEEEEKEENLYKWDLSDETIPMRRHIEAIKDDSIETINGFSDKQKKRFLQEILISKNLIHFINTKQWEKAILTLATNLNENKDLLIPYTSISPYAIAQLVKDLQKEIKNPLFEEKLKKVRDSKEKINLGLLI